MKTKIKLMKYRRRREGRTDYKKRWGLLKSGQPRLVVRRSLKNIIVQVIEYTPDGDKIVASSNSRELIKHGWRFSRSNIPAAYLTGFLCAKKCKKVQSAIFDSGLVSLTKGHASYSALKGAIDGGLKIAHSVENFPSDERISGKHIAKYSKDMKSKKGSNQFSSSFKNNEDIEKIDVLFNEIKSKISKL